MRTIIATIDIDDDMVIAEDTNVLDYLDREFGWLTESGIFLRESKVLDNNDKAIELVDTIFSL